jgi:hypothetical protein
MGVSVPELCKLCYNFDPHQSPADGNPRNNNESWAWLECNISTETPVENIHISKAEDLLNSAQNGCIHCNIVISAPTAMHPRWETEETIIHILLALGLPVTVRLEFGKMFTQITGREAAYKSGVDLPPDSPNQMQTICALKDPSKPDIEVEIYQPHLPSDQSTAGGMSVPFGK